MYTAFFLKKFGDNIYNIKKVVLLLLPVLGGPLVSPGFQVIEYFVPDANGFVSSVAGIAIAIGMNADDQSVASVVIVDRRSGVSGVCVDGVIEMGAAPFLHSAPISVHESSAQFIRSRRCCTCES